MDETHDSKLRSWVEVDENSDFPIQNIPFGIYRPKGGGDLHVATAIGDYVLDLAYLDDAGLFNGTVVEGTELIQSGYNWSPKVRTEAAVDIELGEDSVLRLHEINIGNKIFFEPPVCMHEDCLEE